MEVEIGKEGLKFENGAFTYYGVSALTAPSSGKLGPPGAGGGCRWMGRRSSWSWRWGWVGTAGVPLFSSCRAVCLGTCWPLPSPGCVEGRAGFLQALSLLFFPPLPSLSQEGRICPLVQSPRLHPVAGVISGVDLRGWAGAGPLPRGQLRSLTVLPAVHQSPVSSLQSIHYDPPPEPADSTRLSAYCPDYTVRALSDLQFIKVTICVLLSTGF